ncbi:Zinc finger with UFM1-specific peptidase domain protein [Penaeus vannamei]|uniref:Zinc finger-containing ubiquitin peptidase 1 n=1 Tax=Penaeus vannamei TaxID=6689 RepID=A0A423TES2_PENVA|nr:Zinc finger with UFM1-specific peptidase domain protein [Penaeus vannamei]
MTLVYKAQYGMDNEGNFSQQSLTNMQRAVYAGEMTVADYYERQIELKIAEKNGVDDGRACSKGLLGAIKAVSESSNNVRGAHFCTTVDHYGSTYGDRGWGCGYRNIQMLFSSLQHHTGYYSRLFSGPNVMPSISQLQRLIEQAWRNGFDPQGCEQLGGKLWNTRKWIGATEVVTLLSSFRIKCHLIDCHRPTGADGTHPELFRWCLEYFSKPAEFKPPIYLQHQGHSRTIIGVEQLGGNEGGLRLLVLDPSHSPTQMSQLLHTQTAPAGMRLLRKPLSSMRAKQYQMVIVVGLMETEQEYKVRQTSPQSTLLYPVPSLLYCQAVLPTCSYPPTQNLSTRNNPPPVCVDCNSVSILCPQLPSFSFFLFSLPPFLPLFLSPSCSYPSFLMFFPSSSSLFIYPSIHVYLHPCLFPVSPLALAIYVSLRLFCFSVYSTVSSLMLSSSSPLRSLFLAACICEYEILG